MAARFVADVNHTDHPDFETRKELAARALVAWYLGLRPQKRQIANLIDLATHARHTASRNAPLKESLTTFLDRVVGDVSRVFREQQDSLGPHRAYIDAFIRGAGALACKHCTEGRQCDGSVLHDPAVVADPDSRTLCLAFVIDMFDELLRYAARYYEPLMPASSPPLTVRLRTTVSRSSDQLKADTRYPPEDSLSHRHAELTVEIPIDEFRDIHLADLPYVLFHEIFVHGPESWPTPGPRRATLETCAFREGFVDAAAVHILRKALTERSVQFWADARLNDLLASRALAASKARSSTPRQVAVTSTLENNRTKLAMIREAGATAFQCFEQRGHGHIAAILAASINMMNTTSRQRSAYLTLLEEAAAYIVPDPPGYGSPMNEFAVQLRRHALDSPADVSALRSLLDGQLNGRGPGGETDLDDFDF